MYESDLELARRCAAGDEAAWERFVREYRPILYRAADALDRSGGARELADSLYADLYGVRPGKSGEPRSLFAYFQGRSSLATWLRAVLAQRYVDRTRAARRLEPLPDEDEALPQPALHETAHPDRRRYLDLLHTALGCAVAGLQPRDRLRLALYYVQDVTLAAIGRLLGEHEATVSRQLARTRRVLRDAIEHELRRRGLGEVEIDECFACVAADPGPLDLRDVFDAAGKEPAAEGWREP
jgi:RNA polymerase sigma-70 factor (ECF subfamily)